MRSLLTSQHKKHIQQATAAIQQKKMQYPDSAAQLINQLFGRMSIAEIESHDHDYWSAVAANFIGSMSKSRLRKPLIEVLNPDLAKHGFVDPAITVVKIVHDNVPFVVDTVTMAAAELGADIQLISHPIIKITGGGNDRQITYADSEEEGILKSLMYIEISRLKKTEDIDRLKHKLSDVLQQVGLAVKDWQPMIKALQQSKEHLGHLNSKTVHRQQLAFLDWLEDNNFTFLGYRKYTNKRGKFVAEEETGLGLFNNKGGFADRFDVSMKQEADYQVKKQSDLVIITKTNKRSQVHREGNMDYIGVLETNDKGKIVAEHRFIGLFTSVALNTRPWNIPYINAKVTSIIDKFGFDSQSHSGKLVYHILDALPPDEVLQSSGSELFKMVYEVLTIQEKNTSHLIIRKDKFNRYYSFLIYIPRDRFNTRVRRNMQNILAEAVNGREVEFAVAIDESHLARLYVVMAIDDASVALKPAALKALNDRITDAAESWEDRLETQLIERFGNKVGGQLSDRFSTVFPAGYMDEVSPWVASFDVENIARLKGDDDIQMSLYRPKDDEKGNFRFKIFKFNQTTPLSRVMPILENFGLHVVSERPYSLICQDGMSISIQDFELALETGDELELEFVRERFQQAFKNVMLGVTESDALNQLLILGGLDWRQILLLRSIIKYLLQTGLPYSKDYIEKALINNSHISRWIVELFEVRFKPDIEDMDIKQLRAYLEPLSEKYTNQVRLLNVDINEQQQGNLDAYFNSRKFSRERFTDKLIRIIGSLLDSVSSQDEDRIIRDVVDTIRAVLRTNFFQKPSPRTWKEYISFKIDSSKVAFLPKPVPFREIFVYSPRVEAIHLRMGKVARGGLRWSDRYEDFRTEVLGLMKAQNVKNSIIVPVGSKGGFVVKQLPNGSREEVMQEVVSCYRSFIKGMLDITDNLVKGQVVYPQDVVRYDEDDPYLVVAADKGTATFSDIANGISEDYGFWLGDAFASGGSAGYDHKGMGITAKGAWESVKRHFMEMGVDCQSEDFTVVGIGDMMGDVFGNGMLLSKHICLKGAFNHMHIFLDPNPDSASTWKERKRLFDLPRSSWEDYNQSLISKGGGIYSRADKSIPISPEVKSWLKIRENELAPQDLIKKMILADVDLLWNGGIGTYVKSTDETNADAGDSANNVLRVNGNQLNCKVFGEGGNLGMTQKGRIEFANKGGRLNTDFIDNSAGVDCSDHEVNIKILLKDMMADGLYDLKSRNRLLASMTDNVSDLVLRNNYSQTQTLSFMEHFSVQRLGAKAHLIRVLEAKGLLDRQIEFLPSDGELDRRLKNAEGLSRPELCVLLSYSKLDLYDQIMQTDALDDPWFYRLLVNYFPNKLQKVDEKYLNNHRLKKEIIGTVLTSQVIDRMGATFILRTHEDTGADVGAICKAFFIAVHLFSIDKLWAAIEAHDHKVPTDTQMEALLIIWEFLRQSTRWVINNEGYDLDIQKVIDGLSAGVKKMMSGVEQFLSPKDAVIKKRMQERMIRSGMDAKLAEQIAIIPHINMSLDVVIVAKDTGATVDRVADLYFRIGKSFNVLWLVRMIKKLHVDNRWHVLARGGLRDDLLFNHAGLTTTLLNKYGKRAQADAIIERWTDEYSREVEVAMTAMRRIRNESHVDYPAVMVAVNTIKHLANAVK